MPHPQATRTLPINFSASGDNTVISAVAGAPINVYGLDYTVTGATLMTFKSGAAALSGAYNLTTNGSSQTKHLQEEPYYYCPPGAAFVMNSTNAVSVQGTIYYTQS